MGVRLTSQPLLCIAGHAKQIAIQSVYLSICQSTPPRVLPCKDLLKRWRSVATYLPTVTHSSNVIISIG